MHVQSSTSKSEIKTKTALLFSEYHCGRNNAVKSKIRPSGMTTVHSKLSKLGPKFQLANVTICTIMPTHFSLTVIFKTNVFSNVNPVHSRSFYIKYYNMFRLTLTISLHFLCLYRYTVSYPKF